MPSNPEPAVARLLSPLLLVARWHSNSYIFQMQPQPGENGLCVLRDQQGKRLPEALPTRRGCSRNFLWWQLHDMRTGIHAYQPLVGKEGA